MEGDPPRAVVVLQIREGKRQALRQGLVVDGARHGALLVKESVHEGGELLQERQQGRMLCMIAR